MSRKLLCWHVVQLSRYAYFTYVFIYSLFPLKAQQEQLLNRLIQSTRVPQIKTHSPYTNVGRIGHHSLKMVFDIYWTLSAFSFLVLMQVNCNLFSNQNQQQPLSSEHTVISMDCAAQCTGQHLAQWACFQLLSKFNCAQWKILEQSMDTSIQTHKARWRESLYSSCHWSVVVMCTATQTDTFRALFFSVTELVSELFFFCFVAYGI